MKFRALDQDGDFTFGSGLSGYATGQTAIALNIKTRLAFWLNDFFNAMNFGIDWRNLLGGKNPGAQQGVEQQTKVMVAQSFGVTKINKVFASTDSRTRQTRVTYDIATLYSRSFKQTFTPLA